MKRAPFKICRAYFQASRNRYTEKGYCADFRVFAVFPTARTPKPRKVFFTVSAGYIQARPLFDHAGEAAISPQDWRAMVARAPVDPDPLDETPLEISALMQHEIRSGYLEWADAAERQLLEASQDWRNAVAAKLATIQFGPSGTVEQGRRPMFQPFQEEPEQ